MKCLVGFFQTKVGRLFLRHENLWSVPIKFANDCTFDNAAAFKSKVHTKACMARTVTYVCTGWHSDQLWSDYQLFMQVNLPSSHSAFVGLKHEMDIIIATRGLCRAS